MCYQSFKRDSYIISYHRKKIPMVEKSVPELQASSMQTQLNPINHKCNMHDIGSE